MRSLVTWEPFRDLWNLPDEIERIFWGRRRRGKADEGIMWVPMMDVYEDEEALKVYADLPGLKKEDISVNVEDGILTIKGERKFENEEKKDNYCRIERSYGAFRRSFELPSNVDTNKISATMKDGILTVVIPKKEESKTKEIEVKVL